MDWSPILEWFLPIFSLVRSVSLFINICVNTCMTYILWWKGGNKVYNSESLCVLSCRHSYSNIFLNLKTHMSVWTEQAQTDSLISHMYLFDTLFYIKATLFKFKSQYSVISGVRKLS